MKKKRKLGKATPIAGTSDPSDLPEFLHIALEEDDYGDCECAVCGGDEEEGDCKSPKRYVPEIVKNIERMKAGTLVGYYRLAARHKVAVELVDVDKKGNKRRKYIK
ncbi:hypothetical protein LCGC14_3108970 [marine sediment metagenome]|uniref:Uncharacterized protein n=1 Tax=marine sediment metagenome TaxID=412755 RepID=A0A0F8WUF2_9ZZZZ